MVHDDSPSPSVSEIAAATPASAFYNDRGCWLKIGDGAGGVVTCDDGIATEQCVFKLLQLDGDVWVLALADGGFLGRAGSGFAATEELEAAQRFEQLCQLSASAELTFKLAGEALYLTSEIDGRVVVGATPRWFTAVKSPLMGCVTVAFALRALHGKRVSLWGGPEVGWLTPHPVNFLGLGGNLTCRTHRLCEWECLYLHVLDPGARTVALRSCHGRFVCVSPDGSVACDRVVLDRWEHLVLTQASPGSVSLSSTAHARPMFCGAAGEGGRVDARASSAGRLQRFALFDSTEARRRYALTNPAFQQPAEDSQLSPLAIAGIVAGSLLGAAALSGGIAAGVMHAQRSSAGRAEREAAGAKAAAAAAAKAEQERKAALDAAEASAAAARAAAAGASARAASAERELQRAQSTAAAHAQTVAAAQARVQAQLEAQAAATAAAREQARVSAVAATAARASEAEAQRLREADRQTTQQQVSALASSLASMQFNASSGSSSSSSSSNTGSTTAYISTPAAPCVYHQPAPTVQVRYSYQPAVAQSSTRSVYCGARTKAGGSCRNIQGHCRWH